MDKPHWKTIAIRTLVPVGMMAWAAFAFNWKQVAALLSKGDLFWMMLIVFTMILDRLCRVLRWKLLFAPHRPVELQALYHSYNIGVFMNLLLPARLGELVRIYVLTRQTGLRVRDIFPGIIVEKLLTLLSLILVVLLSFPLLEKLKSTLYGAEIGRWAFLLVSAALILPLAAVSSWLWIRRGLGLSWNGRYSLSLTKRLSSILEPLFSSLSIIPGTRNALVSLSLSFLICFLGILTMEWTMQALGFEASLATGSLLLLTYFLGSLLPAGPGGIGASYAGAAVGSHLLGMSMEDGMAIALLLTLLGAMFSTVLGLTSSRCLGLSLSHLRYKAERLS